MAGEHQRIDAQPLLAAAQGTAQLQIPEVGAQQQDALTAVDGRLVVLRSHQLDLLLRDVATPARQLVERRLAKAQEVAKARSRLGGQRHPLRAGEALEPGQIGLGCLALGTAGQPEVTDDRVEQQGKPAPPQQAVAGQHDLHAEQRSPLRGARPVGMALAPQPGRP
ncbi:hypothetical protein D3C86_1289020 [compost metagenome]